FLFNLALGSGGTPYTGGVAPDGNFQQATMLVDYVKVFRWDENGGGQQPTQNTNPSGMNKCAQDTWAGDTYWKYQLGSWAGASGYYSGGDKWDNFALQLDTFAPTNWGAMIKTTDFMVDKGATYNYTVNFKSNQNGSILFKEDSGSGDEGTLVGITNGNNTYTGSFSAKDDQSAASILMDLRGMTAGAKIEITGFGIQKIGDSQTQTEVPDGFAKATTGEWATVGNWGAYYGGWNGVATGSYTTSTNPFKMYVISNDKADWLIQGRYEQAATPGHKYQVTAKITTNKNGRIGIKEDISNEGNAPSYKDFTANRQETLTGTYDVASDKNAIRVMFEMGSLEAGTTVTFDSIEIKDITLNPPSAPQGLTVSANNETRKLTVNFQTVSNATSYNLYVDGTKKGTISNGATLDMNSYNDGQTYSFAVTAVNNDGESGKSAAYQVTIPKKVVTHNAFSKIEAEAFDSKSGMIVDKNANVSNGENLGGVTNGCYAKYDKVNFTENAKAINFNYASKVGDAQGKVEVYVDNLDNKVGTVIMNNTGSDWSGYKTIQGVLDREITAGTHSIYLKFVTTGTLGYVCNLDYFSFTKTSEYVEPIKVSDNISIDGFQISTISEGIRTVYSYDSKVEGKNVSEVGLVYGINGVSDNDLYVGSNNAYVAYYRGSESAKLSSPISKDSTYTMTMLFKDDKTASNFSKEYKIRAYAKLSDGTYVYTNVKTYSIYSIADKLYQKNNLNTFGAHTYIYNTILKPVNSNYAEIAYNWKNILAKPGEF
ncbi:MAG: carbohydrate-binding protein, partial [Lachnospiraceae bacterium]|nr:carbohydrate-binding protein [Lachnospiraceae bacterium]